MTLIKPDLASWQRDMREQAVIDGHRLEFLRSPASREVRRDIALFYRDDVLVTIRTFMGDAQ